MFFQNYLNNRKQRAALTGSYSNYSIVESGVPQGSVLLFPIYINDLERNIKYSIKFFAADTMLFSIVKNPLIVMDDLNRGLNTIHLWEMEFNPDPTKQATEILLSCKKSSPNYWELIFNGTLAVKASEQNI